MKQTDKLLNALNRYELDVNTLLSLRYRELWQTFHSLNEDDGLAYLDWMLLASQKNDLHYQRGEAYRAMELSEDHPLAEYEIVNPCIEPCTMDTYVNPMQLYTFDEIENFFVSLKQMG